MKEWGAYGEHQGDQQQDVRVGGLSLRPAMTKARSKEADLLVRHSDPFASLNPFAWQRDASLDLSVLPKACWQATSTCSLTVGLWGS